MRPWPERFVHPALRADAEVLRRARLTVLLSVVLVATGAVYAAFYGVVVGYQAGARILGGGAAATCLVLALLRTRPWLRTCAHLVTAMLFGVIVGLIVCEGGLRALATPLLSLPPILAVLLLGRRSAVGWTVLCVLTIVAFGAVEARGMRFPVLYPDAWAGRMSIGSPIGLVICTALLLFAFETMRAEVQARADTATAALARMAYQDALTGLANRARFLDRLDGALAGACAAGAPARVAVLLLDLDGFKAVNDAMGHAAGDALLVQVGARLLNATRGADTVARLGGDEFAVLLEGVRDDAETEIVAERIVSALGRPFVLELGEGRIGASLGVARATHGVVAPTPPLATASPDAAARAPQGVAASVLRDADLALYRAKSLGRGRWVRFEPDMLSLPRMTLPGTPRDVDGLALVAV